MHVSGSILSVAMQWRAGSECGDRTVCDWIRERTGNETLANIGDWFLRAPLRITIILLVAWFVTKMARRVITRATSGFTMMAGLAPSDRERAQLRTRTVSSVLRSATIGVIWAIAAITIVSELGINLGAFVVTATVIGGAVGFGAQQVVRDFLAGVFVVAEDQYGVGDLIDVGHVEGTVEKVSLRSVQLRDAHGKVWHVPHGNIARVANLSQGWANAVLDVPVARTMGEAQATSALLDAAHRAIDPPEIAAIVLAEPRVLGVQDLLDDRMILRLVVRTRPARQHEVQRRLRSAVMDAARVGTLPLPDAGPTMVLLPTPPATPSDEDTAELPPS